MTRPSDAQVLANVERWLDSSAAQRSTPLVGAGYQAAIHLVRGAEGSVIVKQARNTGPLAWLRRATLRREYKAYRKLDGLAGIPHCFGLVRERYLVLAYVQGPSLREAENLLEDHAAFFDELLEVVQHMHRRGVAHGDLKRKDNILVGPGEHPFIVDFGTAHFRPGGAGALRSWLFRFMRQTDYNAYIKRKYRRDYQNMSADDRELYRPLPLEVTARVIRESWRQLTFRRLRKRLRSRG